MRLNRPTRGFTLVEVMIIVVIIGLFAAMAIPAVTRIRFNVLQKEIQSGARVTSERRAWYQETLKDHPDWAAKGTKPADPEPIEQSVSTPNPFAPIIIKGKTYVLVPKQDAEETTIAGQRYWIIPAPVVP